MYIFPVLIALLPLMRPKIILMRGNIHIANVSQIRNGMHKHEVYGILGNQPIILSDSREMYSQYTKNAHSGQCINSYNIVVKYDKNNHVISVKKIKK